MIFVTLGSQKFQFNRLLREIDNLIERGIIKEKVFAQIGYSDYLPKRFEFKKFIDRNEFSDVVNRCSLVITHGGTGAIIGAVKKSKKVIAVPRRCEYGEHVDNHQIQLVKQFDSMGIIRACYELDELETLYLNIGKDTFISYISNTDKIMDSIEEFINCN